jgi:hypothetical protein
VRLQRAVAAFISERIEGLYVFKDDLAFVAAGNPYPYLLIDLISAHRKSLGTGVWDRISPTESGGIATKAVSVQQVLRLTVRAANTRTQSGNAAVGDLCDQIEALLGNCCREGSMELPDPESDRPLRIERILFQGRYDIPPIEKGAPFVYQQALSYLFVEQRVTSVSIPKRLERIGIALTRV